MPDKEEIKNRHEQARRIVREAGGNFTGDLNGPCDWNRSFRMEFWTVPKGMVILQLWEDGGVTCYADWSLGKSWEDLRKALAKTEIKS